MKKNAHARRKPGRPERDVARDLISMEDFALIRKLIAAASEDDEQEDLETLFRRVLLLGQGSDIESDAKNQNELLADLLEALTQARIDANGGDPYARRELKTVRGLLDEAAGRDALHPALLIILGRTFAGAGLDIGEAARAALQRAIAKGDFVPAGEEFYAIFVAPLLAMADDNPFDLYEAVDQMTAIFPLDYKIALVTGLVADDNPLARQAAVGLLLHPDKALALAAIRALAAAPKALDAQSRQRIETIRIWLAPDLQAAAESAFGPAAGGDLRALSPASTKIVRLSALVRDGSGASALFGMLKRGSRYAVASVMIKPQGVVEALLHEDLARADADMMQAMLGSPTPSYAIRPAAFARILRLALGQNVASKTAPPFSLIGVAESIGLDSLAPDASTPGEIINTLLAEVPDRDHKTRIARAHQDVADSEFAENWFEAGDEVDETLRAAVSLVGAEDLLLKSYLPARRDFWAAQCALSALVLKEDAAAKKTLWRQLALVGRDIAGDKPLDAIPLMRRIAEQSAATYFAAD